MCSIEVRCDECTNWSPAEFQRYLKHQRNLAQKRASKDRSRSRSASRSSPAPVDKLLSITTVTTVSSVTPTTTASSTFVASQLGPDYTLVNANPTPISLPYVTFSAFTQNIVQVPPLFSQVPAPEMVTYSDVVPPSTLLSLSDAVEAINEEESFLQEDDLVDDEGVPAGYVSVPSSASPSFADSSDLESVIRSSQPPQLTQDVVDPAPSPVSATSLQDTVSGVVKELLAGPLLKDLVSEALAPLVQANLSSHSRSSSQASSSRRSRRSYESSRSSRSHHSRQHKQFPSQGSRSHSHTHANIPSAVRKTPPSLTLTTAKRHSTPGSFIQTDHSERAV